MEYYTEKGLKKLHDELDELTKVQRPAITKEIADGLGTGNRRAREARLQQLDKDKKKRLIRLICRVKGEEVYDETKEVGDIQLRLDDVDMVINKVIGTMKVSTEWEVVPWDYRYDK